MHQNNKIILLVEDTPTLAHMYSEFLKREGFSVTTAITGAEALASLKATKPDAIVLDLLLPDMNGLEILKHAHESMPDVPVIVVTITNSINVAVEAMRGGAYDYIVKPFLPPRLIYTLRHALDNQSLNYEVKELRQLTMLDHFHGFVGQSAAMQAVYRTIDIVAPSRTSVFITGESGTGKEVAAHAIHNASQRRNKPFVPVNCAAIPRDLMESMLFGHVKGAFTGAISDQMGAIRSAQDGTLFLDEICEMPLELQAKLLRFAQTGEVTPVGSTRTEIIDVRIISATNRLPMVEVKTGKFREDLYYRLHIIPLEMPPLRDRDDDVLIMASHFMSRFSAEEKKAFTSLSPEVMSMFRRYDWPGNVRQMENVIRNIVVLHDGLMITEDMLPRDMQKFMGDVPSFAANQNADDIMFTPDGTNNIKPMWQIEKEAILQALELSNQDVAQAAAMLEISPSTFYRKLQQYREKGNVTAMYSMQG